jgi:hypothetical protein
MDTQGVKIANIPIRSKYKSLLKQIQDLPADEALPIRLDETTPRTVALGLFQNARRLGIKGQLHTRMVDGTVYAWLEQPNA